MLRHCSKVTMPWERHQMSSSVRGEAVAFGLEEEGQTEAGGAVQPSGETSERW